MTDEDSMEGMADAMIEYTKSVIDLEQHEVKERHSLEHIQGWDLVFEHIASLVEDPRLHEPTQDMMLTAMRINQLCESGDLRKAELVEEEQHFVERLEEEHAHHRWQVVKHEFESDETEKQLRSSVDELRQLRDLFEQLMRQVEQLEKHISLPVRFSLLRTLREKTDHQDPLHYYLYHVYALARFYHHLFEVLLRKEKKLIIAFRDLRESAAHS